MAQIYLADILKGLTTFCSQNLKSSAEFPTESFNGGSAPLKQAIRQIEELVGVPQREAKNDYFIRAIVSLDGFQRLAYPDLALAKIDGFEDLQPAFIWHNCIIPASKLFQENNKTIKFKTTGGGSNTLYALTISHPENEETEEFEFRTWTKQQLQSETYSPVKLKRDWDYLCQALAPYVFPLSWLSDGRHTVTEINKKEKGFTAKIDNTLYYISETYYKQLEENKGNNKPTDIIVDGMRSYVKDGVTKTFKNIYVFGFPPPTKIKYAVQAVYDTLELAKTTGEKEIKDGMRFDPPIVFEVKDVLQVNPNKGNPAGFLVVVAYGTQDFNLVPNSTIKRAYNNGTFDLRSYEGVKLSVHRIEKYGDNLRFIIDFEIPDSAKKVNEAFADLALLLGV